MDKTPIIITKKDLLRLENIIQKVDSDDLENLEIELQRAVIVEPDKIPSDIVTMNSQVEYVDIKTGKSKIVTLVFPEEADFENGKISILAPIGSALIGLKEGQEISWKVPSGSVRTFKVVKIHYQPEKEKDWHL